MQIPSYEGVDPSLKLAAESGIKPENIIIRNGKIGLSSHQAILGNNNKYVLLENLEISNFC